MLQGRGAEKASSGGGGYEGDHGEGLPGLRQSTRTVTSFKYLGQILTASDDDWPAVVGNLRKARKSWTCLSRFLLREEVNLSLSGMFFKAVVQALLLLGEEMWVMTPHVGWALGGVPTQGSTTDHGEAAPEVSGRELVISTSVIVNAGSGI